MLSIVKNQIAACQTFADQASGNGATPGGVLPGAI